MRILLAGATGAIGRRLVPLLSQAGHEVVAMSRSSSRAAALGVEIVEADALDAPAVRRAVEQARPERIIHQLTAIPQRINPRRMERDFAANDRLRIEGTRNLIAAAPGVPVLAQSIAFAYAPGAHPGTLHVESDPLFLDAPGAWRRSVLAVLALETAVLETGGVVLRYGYFHGPGTAHARDGALAQEARRRRFPILGDGAGLWSFVHVDDAAEATLAALEHPGPATFNIVDDHPEPPSEWLPRFAASVDAPKPLRLPLWLGRLAAGAEGVAAMTRDQGASNSLAKQELDWQPTRQPAFSDPQATAPGR